MNKSILYVSKYSEPSMKFLNKFQQVPISKTFDVVYVEDNIHNLDEMVTGVPCIHIPILDKPFIGGEAFKWLSQLSKGVSINNEKMNYTPQVEKQEQQGDIKDFDSTMGNGFSDDFSFIDDNNPQKHSFEFINDNNSIQVDNNIPKKTNIKEDILAKRMEEMEKERSEIFTI
jgi:hypothetical protein